jgi:hypothetical protein
VSGRKFDWRFGDREASFKPSKEQGAILDDDNIRERRAWEVLDIWCNDQSSGERIKIKVKLDATPVHQL